MSTRDDVLRLDPLASATIPESELGVASPRPPLTVTAKLLFAVGNVSESIKSFTFGLFLLFFYSSVLGLPGTLVGIGASIGLVWDGLVDPYIGHLSDRLRFRYGGRHSFMLVGAVCMGVSFFAIFRPPAGLGSAGLFVWLMVTSLLLRTSNSIFMVPYSALGVELSQDYHERTSITAFRAMASLAGTLLAASLSFVVFFPSTTPGVDPKFNPGGYAAMALAFGLVMTITGLLAIAGSWSYRPRGAGASLPMKQALPFTTGVALALRNRPFLIVALSSSLFFLASVSNAALSIHYLTYRAGITASGSLSLIQLAFYVGALVGVPCWLHAARVIDKHRLYSGAVILTALVLTAAYALVGEGRLFGTGNAIPLIVGNILAGMVASALWILPPSMVADVTDTDHLATGQKREGAFTGIYSFIHQAAASIAVLLSGILIDQYAALAPGQSAQSAQTVERLAVLYGLMPAAILVVAACLVLRYDLTQQRVRMIQAELQARPGHSSATST